MFFVFDVWLMCFAHVYVIVLVVVINGPCLLTMYLRVYVFF